PDRPADVPFQGDPPLPALPRQGGGNAGGKRMSGTYEVLSPWAEVDPVPQKGISPRLPELSGRRIGLFHNNKVAARPNLDAVEAELRSRFSDPDDARAGRTARGSV